jgi:hypothetical protein
MVRPAPAASRATEILDHLVFHPTEGFTLSQIARARQMHVATGATPRCRVDGHAGHQGVWFPTETAGSFGPPEQTQFVRRI